MSTETIYLVTGANRGIGKGITQALLRRENTTVLATVRDPSDTTSQALSDLPRTGSVLHILQLDSTSPKSVTAAAKTVEQLGIHHIDVVLANAGISKYYGTAFDTPAEELTEHLHVNAVGPLLLFQAFYNLLEKSSKPKFIAVTTGLASIADMYASRSRTKLFVFETLANSFTIYFG
jgi:norsolorinic acid ketoreductase